MPPRQGQSPYEWAMEERKKYLAEMEGRAAKNKTTVDQEHKKEQERSWLDGLASAFSDIPLVGDVSEFAGRLITGDDPFGTERAAAAAKKGQQDAANAFLAGMDKSIAAQREGFGHAQRYLDPYHQRGLGYLDEYAGLARNPNLDMHRQDYKEAQENLDARLSGMGIHNSSFAGRQHGIMASDYASKMYEARLRAMQPLLGVGPSAAGALAGAATGTGSGIAGTTMQGHGLMGQSMQQQGMLDAQSQMAQTQNWMNMLMLGLQGYGMFGGGSPKTAGPKTHVFINEPGLPYRPTGV